MSNRLRLSFGPLVLSVIFASAAYAKDLPFVSQIEGDKVIIVKTADGKNQTASQGTSLNIGDHLRTGPNTSAVIVYPDGSKIFVGRGSDLTLQENNGKSQFSELAYGQIRGLVKKSSQNAVGTPPRFIVRSKAAVMGVRGTDFVFEVTETAKGTAQDAAVHTLDGLVEVAKDEATLLAGKGVAVMPGFAANATAAGVMAAQEFDAPGYMKELAASQPDVIALVNADPESREHSRVDNLTEPVAEPPSPPAPVAEVKEAQAPEPEHPRLQFRMFQLAGVATIQEPSLKTGDLKIGGGLVTAKLTWNPTLRLLGPIHLRGNFGITPLKEKDSDFFVMLEAGVLASLVFFDRIVIEAGVGSQVWSGRSKWSPAAWANLGYKLGYDTFIERIFLGASVYEYEHDQVGMSEFSNHGTGQVEIRAGAGFQF